MVEYIKFSKVSFLNIKYCLWCDIKFCNIRVRKIKLGVKEIERVF